VDYTGATTLQIVAILSPQQAINLVRIPQFLSRISDGIETQFVLDCAFNAIFAVKTKTL
jgi:hypothetical protein